MQGQSPAIQEKKTPAESGGLYLLSYLLSGDTSLERHTILVSGSFLQGLGVVDRLTVTDSSSADSSHFVELHGGGSIGIAGADHVSFKSESAIRIS